MNTIILIASFSFMEFLAWFAHKYVMHTFGWSLHRDHHFKEPDQTFELNDLYFLIFAAPGISFLFFGYHNGSYDPLFWVGAGISLYGMAYVFVHDIFIHQRLKILTRTQNTYLLAMRKAHKIHHKHLQKEHGECFGFLWVPPKYLKEAHLKKRS
ncbi:MAG: beta-carotene hydroxylase [Calditrichaeota bacterium]|nr:MAG: beta-carotene hydroxylase [Calditrichota bacterium]MBL1207816.1 beta-carotene hydroxylase [Calditrichota bacterium]NOG47650.1 beta-carotene hydroxylase [Calditrichota bacterium]